MAITSTKVKSSNVRPLKAGHKFVEVEIIDNAANASGTITPAIPLGQSYRRIKPISAVVNTPGALSAYAANSASVNVVDTANVRLLYLNSAANATVTATLECEV